jgi:hypothetical protein
LEHFKQIKGKEEDKGIKDAGLFNEEKRKKIKGKKINGLKYQVPKAEIRVNNVSTSVLIPYNFSSRYCFDDNSYFNVCKWQEYVGGKLLGGRNGCGLFIPFFRLVRSSVENGGWFSLREVHSKVFSFSFFFFFILLFLFFFFFEKKKKKRKIIYLYNCFKNVY